MFEALEPNAEAMAGSGCHISFLRSIEGLLNGPANSAVSVAVLLLEVGNPADSFEKESVIVVVGQNWTLFCKLSIMQTWRPTNFYQLFIIFSNTHTQFIILICFYKLASDKYFNFDFQIIIQNGKQI